MAAFFITSTGTDIGKTFVTCALIRQLRAQGKAVHAIKPVISGYDDAHPEGSDTYLLAEALGLAWSPATADALSPYRYVAAQSPHLAAVLEGRTIPTENLLSFCQQHITARGQDTLLIEGAGGVMTPISDTLLTHQWIAHLQIPVILVVGSYLGSISHSLTALSVLSAQAIPVAAVIVSASPDSPVALEDTIASLERFSGLACPILPLPRHSENDTMTLLLPELTKVLK